jgi:hypothetical protein
VLRPAALVDRLQHGAATLMLAAGIADAVAIKMLSYGDTRILRRYQTALH